MPVRILIPHKEYNDVRITARHCQQACVTLLAFLEQDQKKAPELDLMEANRLIQQVQELAAKVRGESFYLQEELFPDPGPLIR